MYSKLLITGDIVVKTGLHIGTSDDFSAIGAVDAPVVRDGQTGLPIIPGSSLKGKMRTLLSRAIQNDLLTQGPEHDHEIVKRLFGATSGGGTDGKGIIPSRLIFSDCTINNLEDIPRQMLTEVKSENSINRGTGVANPRFIERVVPGVRFGLRLIYDVTSEEDVTPDFEAIAAAMQLLSMDYLGGHGTRGSGRIAFQNINVEQIALRNLSGEKAEITLTPLEEGDISHIVKQVLNDEIVSL